MFLSGAYSFHFIVSPKHVLRLSLRNLSLTWIVKYHITMAALDPTEAPEPDEDGEIPSIPRSTLKLIRKRITDMDDELDDEYLDQLMGASASDEDDDDEEDSDDEPNGGPSDPAKSKRARQEAALQKLIQAAQEEEDSDEEMADGSKPKANGIAKASKKGKEPATSSDDEEEDDDSISSELDLEELVVCTLDTERVCLPHLSVSRVRTHIFYRTTSSRSILPSAPMRRFSLLSRVLTPST